MVRRSARLAARAQKQASLATDALSVEGGITLSDIQTGDSSTDIRRFIGGITIPDSQDSSEPFEFDSTGILRFAGDITIPDSQDSFEYIEWSSATPEGTYKTFSLFMDSKSPESQCGPSCFNSIL